MPVLIVGPEAFGLSPDHCRWLEVLQPACNDFVVDTAYWPLCSRVTFGCMESSQPEDWATVNDHRRNGDGCDISPITWIRSLKLRKTATSYIATHADKLAITPGWVAMTDHRFEKIALRFDPVSMQRSDKREGLILSSCCSILVLRSMHRLAGVGAGLLLHTAAVRIDERIWLFPGRSGVGKSTFSRLCLDRAECLAVNDDRVVLYWDFSAGRFLAYSFPWPGKDRLSRNQSAPLAGICFLHQGKSSEIRALAPQQALAQLLAVAAIPWYDQDLVGPALDVCDRLLSNVPAYELHFSPDQTAVDAVLTLAAR